MVNKYFANVDAVQSRRQEPYYGRFIGRLTQYAHGIKGSVYAVDENTVFVRNFAYDGTGPDAYFWVGDTPQPSPEGILVPYPEDYTTRDFKQSGLRNRGIKISVYAVVENTVFVRNFAYDGTGPDAYFWVGDTPQPSPEGILVPYPEDYTTRDFKQSGLRNRGIKISVYAVDENTVFVRNFAYDGTGPDAYFWVGDTPQPSPEGILVPYPEDYTTRDPPILTSHSNTDILLRLPGGKRLRDIKWLSVWCRRFTRVVPPVHGKIAMLASRSHSDILLSSHVDITQQHRHSAAAAGRQAATRHQVAQRVVPPVHGKVAMLASRSHSDILLRLPGGKRLRDIKWLSVWCRRFTVNFGDVFIPPGLDPPRPRVLPEFKRLAHGLRSGNISVLDAKTFYIPNLHYDGAGPDAYFWVGNGSDPNPFGTKVPNEMGSLSPLRGYQGEDIEIQLPGKLTAYDIDWLAVWCVEYRHNFGHVFIPKDLDVPPALGQTKITTSSTTSQTPYSAANNCAEILDKRLQVRWEMLGDQVQITLSARLRKEQYMAFGISGAEGRPAMLGADVVVAYWDTRVDQPRVADYTITHLAQCDGERGVCPDQRLGGSNDVVLVSGAQKNGVTTITYRRPISATEPGKDLEILTSRSQSVIAAFGPLNSRYEANAHSFMDTTRNDVQLDFGINNENNCLGLAELDVDGPTPWPTRVIAGVTNFTARIGPAGGARGYTPITDNDISNGFMPGHPSWGIAWYINDQLIPEIYVERGKTYTFFVEGGNDSTNPAKFHPFYISDSSEGGFGQKKEEDQRKQRVFAGVAYDNEQYPFPTAVGRYCEWTHKTVDQAASSQTFEEYMKTLDLKCSDGEPAVLNWTVAHETPDLVYYQCYTHNNLGWKIHVVDPGTPIPYPIDQRAGLNAACIFAPFTPVAILALLTALRYMAAR
ncbi:hypothetical protein O0L34_g14691 [Tuta absoluta]|nr:hypothetical protein O0L34_g14691 [Tuta absoluta]